MAQAAFAFQDNQAVGVSLLTAEEAVTVAKAMLSNFLKIDEEITARRNRAKATGKKFLNKYQKQLALVGKAYADRAGYDHMHQEKAEAYFGEQKRVAAARHRFNDAAALAELEGLMIGTTAWGGRDAEGTDWKGKVVTFEREDHLCMEEMQDLEEERAYIIETLSQVDKMDKRAGAILIYRYMYGKSVSEVIERLEIEQKLGSVAESTYHEWHKKALHLFARMAGLCG